MEFSDLVTAGPETPCDLQHAMNGVSLLALKRGKVIYLSAKSNFFFPRDHLLNMLSITLI